MQSKMTLIVLFMLAFNVMHDSVMHMMEKSEHTSVSHYVNTDVNTVECAEVQELHNLLHFVGLIVPHTYAVIQMSKDKIFMQPLLQDTLPHKETSYKPPIA